MNELASNEASLRKRGGIFIIQGYLMPLRVGNELVLGNGLESDPAEPIRIFISPSCLCFFVFATCFHSLQNSFHVEENMNNPSLLLQFQPPTETDELALSHRPHSLERDSALPSLVSWLPLANEGAWIPSPNMAAVGSPWSSGRRLPKKRVGFWALQTIQKSLI